VWRGEACGGDGKACGGKVRRVEGWCVEGGACRGEVRRVEGR
jgi:hypothetical protein